MSIFILAISLILGFCLGYIVGYNKLEKFWAKTLVRNSDLNYKEAIDLIESLKNMD